MSTANGHSFTYDDNGNTLSDGERSYSWTSFDKPDLITKDVGLPTETHSRFIYGPDPSRFLQSVKENNEITQVSYAFGILSRLDKSGQLKESSNMINTSMNGVEATVRATFKNGKLERS